MNWDHAQPFIIDIMVPDSAIDELGHVNNAVYVRWLEQCAWAHSEQLGLDLALYQQLDRAMAVLRHEIDYLAAAYANDALQMATWIVGCDSKLKLQRHFQLQRMSDGATLLRANTTFVCIEISTGRPKRMPDVFVTGYGGAVLGTMPA